MTRKYKYGMVIDLDKCTGCGTCMVACAAENNVAVRPDQSDKERTITWMRLYRISNGKKFPHTEVGYFQDHACTATIIRPVFRYALPPPPNSISTPELSARFIPGVLAADTARPLVLTASDTSVGGIGFHRIKAWIVPSSRQLFGTYARGG